jgi:catechol 2,3-dioxygenase-like lactoylglutathione lyase family enzyme
MGALRDYRLGHITLRVTDLTQSKRFYVDTLDFQIVLETEGLLLCSVGDTLVGPRGAEPETRLGDRFDPFRVGLDEAGVRNNGVELDHLTNARYISFYDPDGIAWELYAMPGPPA